MKKTSLVLVLLLSLATVGFAQGASEKKATSAASGSPKISDILVVGRLNDAAYLDPNAPSVGGAEVNVTQQIYEGLVTVSDDGTSIIPCLASDWTISDDGLTYTFNLVPGVKFSDGTPVTGADWEWSLLRARDLETSAYRFIAEAIDTVKATDSQVVITLKYPWATFLADLACFNMVVGSKAHYDALGEDAYLNNPLGTGPYMLKEWKKENYILLEANPYYRQAGYPKTKQLKFQIISDDNTRMMQLQAGQVDVCGDVPFTLVQPMKNEKNITIQVFPSTQIRYLILNTTKAPFDDIRVRQALVHGIDKQEISDLVAGEFGAPVAALVSEAEGKWFNGDLKVAAYEPEVSKKLLADAGYTSPVPFTISIRSGSAIYEQIATLLKSQLDKAGFDVTIEELERASISAKYSSLSHQATILQWVDDITDPSGLTGWTVDYDQSNAWYTGLKDEELDALNVAASRELDETKRIAMYHEIQQRVADNANVIPLFRNGFAYAYDKNVEGLYISPFSVVSYKNVVKYVK